MNLEANCKFEIELKVHGYTKTKIYLHNITFVSENLCYHGYKQLCQSAALVISLQIGTVGCFYLHSLTTANLAFSPIGRNLVCFFCNAYTYIPLTKGTKC